jgi:hypothetical protein
MTDDFIVKGIDELSLKEFEVKVDEDRGTFRVDTVITNLFNFDLQDCYLILVVAPIGIKRKEDKSHKKSYEEYSAELGVLRKGENKCTVVFKGQTSGTYKIKKCFIKVSHYKYKVPLPQLLKLRELRIQVTLKSHYSK